MVKGLWKLRLRLIIAVSILVLILAVIIFIGWIILREPGGIFGYLIATCLIVFIHYFTSPYAVERDMFVRPLRKEEAPQIYEMVEDICKQAKIKMPEIKISSMLVPNAFAYGTVFNSKICVTEGLMEVLTYNEIRAVLAHEIGHVKHKDTTVQTFISIVPLISYYIMLLAYIATIQNRYDSNQNEERRSEMQMLLITFGCIAAICYFIGQLLILFISRTREYYADQASVEYGSQPEHMVSALYKITYGTSLCEDIEIKYIQGHKAFLLNDVNKVEKSLDDFSQIDFNMNGKIEKEEVEQLRESKVKIKFMDKIMELTSTHPDTLKRVKRLSDITKE